MTNSFLLQDFYSLKTLGVYDPRQRFNDPEMPSFLEIIFVSRITLALCYRSSDLELTEENHQRKQKYYGVN